MSVRVVTAAEAAARDSAAIAAGTPSRTLMQRAGAGAAGAILRHFGPELREHGVVVITGPGNNGGDGWVVAGELARSGLRVRVHEVLASRTPDAIAARAEAQSLVQIGEPKGTEGVLVDALLGTGSRGDLTGPIRDAVTLIRERKAAGARVVSLDLPTGADASRGAGSFGVAADLTVSFGTVKRGHLVSRGACGAIEVVDIGLGQHADLDDGAPTLVDEAFVHAHVPGIGAESDKGIRRRVVIAGGARGMAGAVILAGRAAARSGVGMVRLLVEEPSLLAVQSGFVEATADTWPIANDRLDDLVNGYATAVAIGPGLGRSEHAAAFLSQLLEVWRGPVVLDADALNHFAGNVAGLKAALGGRPALITPHANEMARLVGSDAATVLDQRFEIGREVSREAQVTVLLKGVPTVISGPDGAMHVSASGTPVLAAAGSGDLLAGIAVTLLAQTGDPTVSAACAAWVHGRAAELANAGRTVRGVTLDDVASALAWSWRFGSQLPEPPTLLALPRVGDA